MNLYKKCKSFISLVCAVSLILSIICVPVAADDTNRVTAATGAAIVQGNSAYCYVDIDSAEGLASLDVSVYFDPAKVKVIGVYNSIGCTLYDNVTNTDNIRFSYIFDGQGAATKTRLFYFRYQVLENAEVGGSYFDIVVGEAYDSSLNEMAVSGSRCGFKISKATVSKDCYVYGSRSISTSIKQEFTLGYRLSTSEIASGTAVISYDPDLLEVVEVTNGAFLDGKIVDINKDLSGEIYISFVGTEYGIKTDFVSVTFRTVKNAAESSDIVFTAKELLDKNLDAYFCSGYTTKVNMTFDETYAGDSPAMRLDGSFSYDDMQITLAVCLEANSHLGAGDFVISFDPEFATYNSCTKGFEPSFFNINDKNTDSGELKFHIISLSDIVTEETVLTVVFDVKRPYSRETADFTLDGTGLTDSMTESILLNFIDESVWLEYKVTFCDEDGTLLQSGMYHYGDTVNIPDPPAKESDAYGNYTFNGWDKVVEPCTADAIYTATYVFEYTDYTVVFLNWDGTELSKRLYHYRDAITAPEEPKKVADNTYTYSFIGWDSELVCTGNMMITAIYEPSYIDYTVIFKDWDGTELSKGIYHYGDAVTMPDFPQRAAEDTCTYTFTGWDKDFSAFCEGNAVYTAVYDVHYHEFEDGVCKVCKYACTHKDNDTNHLCDICGVTVSEHIDSDKNHLCDICGKSISNHADDDNNHICDLCGKTVSNHIDSNKDHICDICGKAVSNHVDDNKDHVCDICGKTVSNHVDDNNNHICDICGKAITNHVDENNNHVCDICGKTVSNHVDSNNDHVCDICGKAITNHVDENNNHVCDICGEAVSNHVDDDNNHLCDTCGKTVSNHVDDNNNHICDICGKAITNHVDENNNHVCDICGKTVSNHVDSNNDHVCDICGKAVSNHVDDDNNHICDLCGKTVSNHSDENHDHVCDICGETISTHTGGTATCTKKAVCEICGEAYGELNPENHTGGTHIKHEKAATCTEKGYTGDTYCNGCNEKIADGSEIPTKPHTPGEKWVIENGKKVKKCTECGTVVDTLKRLPGDVDGDGEITMLDCLYLKRYILGTYNGEIVLENADVDGNGRIDATDYLYLKRGYLGTFDLSKFA